MPVGRVRSLATAVADAARGTTLRNRLLLAPMLALLLIGGLVAGYKWADARQIWQRAGLNSVSTRPALIAPHSTGNSTPTCSHSFGCS